MIQPLTQITFKPIFFLTARYVGLSCAVYIIFCAFSFTESWAAFASFSNFKKLLSSMPGVGVFLLQTLKKGDQEVHLGTLLPLTPLPLQMSLYHL